MTRVVVKALIGNEKNEFLTIQRAKDEAIDPGGWEFPGGKVKYGEDPLSALMREVKEEVGLDVDILRVLTTWSRTISNTHYVGMLFQAKCQEGNVLLSNEHDDYRWVEMKELLTYDLYEPIRTELQRLFM